MSSLHDIAFAQLRSVSAVDRRELVRRFGSATGVIEAAKAGKGSTDVEKAVFVEIRKELDLKGAEKELDRLSQLGGWVCAFGSTTYPALLAEIPDPPLVLFGRGRLPAPNAKTIGVVGSRRPSAYGRRITKLLVQDFAREGMLIVSGLARGIDSIAHETALQEKGATMAVIGTGLDQSYPPEHAFLQEEIAKRGAVVTEFPCGTPPRKEHFPQRNRILSGLSKGVLVTEAAEKSGTQITARMAMEQNREVYAVPGPIDSPQSWTPNWLISQGAKLVSSSQDVLDDFFPQPSSKKRVEKFRDVPDHGLSGEAQQLLGRIGERPISMDELASEGKFPFAKLMEAITELELKGRIAKQTDARYSRV